MGGKPVKHSAIPIYAIGIVWVLYALFLPLYRVWDFLGAAAASLIVFFLLDFLLRKKPKPAPVENPAAEAPAKSVTGDPVVDQLLRDGKECLTQIRSKAAQIRSNPVQNKIYRLDVLCTRIFAFVEEKPKSAPLLRKFLNYYMPTFQKLVDSYATLEKQGIQGENITSSMQRIEEMLDTMGDAFEKQLDALFADVALDISTDITVMEGMMAREGLAEMERNRPDDEDPGEIKLTL